MAFVVGSQITDWLIPRNGAGTPISGIASTLQANLLTEDPMHNAFAVTITEEGTTGRYSIYFTPNAVGLWFWATHHNTPLQMFDETYDVVTPEQADPAGSFSGQLVSGQNPVSADGGLITLRRGVSYSTALENPLTWTYTGPVALTPASSITLSIHSRTVRVEVVCTLTGTEPAQTITAELTGVQTDELLISQVTVYEMTALIDGNEVVLFSGDVSVLPDVSP